MKKSFFIIDGNALLHRAWHAIPPLTTRDGTVVNAVYGFTMVLLKILNDWKPDAIAVAFDTPEPTFRDKAYEPYKAHREKQPDELYEQIPLIKDVLGAFSIPVIEAPGFEADDILGTMATRVAQETNDMRTVIVTGDMDTMQLVNDRTQVLTFKKGVSDTMVYDAAAVQERYGLSPAQMIDYKALRGDPSDNIPGVRGIGEKTATVLLQKFATLDNVYEHLDDASITPSVRKKLADGKDMAKLSRELVTIKCDMTIDLALDACTWGEYDEQAVHALFQKFEFRTLLARLPKQGRRHSRPSTSLRVNSSSVVDVDPRNSGDDEQKKVVPPGYIFVNTPALEKEFFAALADQTMIAFDTETDSLNTRHAKLIGISVSWKSGDAYYMDVRDGVPAPLRAAIESDAVKKTGHNIKYDMAVLATNGITPRGFIFDTMIASYVLNAAGRQHSLDALAFEHFGVRMTQTTELIGTGKKQITMAEVPREQVAAYACADADIAWRLYEQFSGDLKKEGLDALFADIEMPLVPILSAMERKGIVIDTVALQALAKTLGKRIVTLEATIYEHAGGPFNVASPKQLKSVLFERLAISTLGIGKTKTGISTAAEQLEKLRDAHPIIPLIMEYRELAKLKSTYLDALPLLVDADDHRLHTSYNQTVAATGRLSSSDPNLQNIPVRTELGNEIRKAFIAAPGHVLLAADYSQIELRIAAHVSADPTMIDAFRKGEDIHARTAAEINGVAIDAVTKEMRYAAKAVNFGILYGMGSSSLARSTGLSRDEARAFIDKYFLVYPKLREYIDATIALAHTRGFVETMVGRRRAIPEITSRLPMMRAQAERMAVNMPIQGSSADIIKMAMIALHRVYPPFLSSIAACLARKREAALPASLARGLVGEGERGVRMLLQVHDELIFEVQEAAVPAAAKAIKDTMENIVKLSVPLVVDIKTGQSWGEMKSV